MGMSAIFLHYEDQHFNRPILKQEKLFGVPDNFSLPARIVDITTGDVLAIGSPINFQRLPKERRHRGFGPCKARIFLGCRAAIVGSLFSLFLGRMLSKNTPSNDDPNFFRNKSFTL